LTLFPDSGQIRRRLLQHLDAAEVNILLPLEILHRASSTLASSTLAASPP
jgi:hypothetical protein